MRKRPWPLLITQPLLLYQGPWEPTSNKFYHKIGHWLILLLPVTEINFLSTPYYKFLFTLVDVYCIFLSTLPSSDNRTNIKHMFFWITTPPLFVILTAWVINWYTCQVYQYTYKLHEPIKNSLTHSIHPCIHWFLLIKFLIFSWILIIFCHNCSINPVQLHYKQDSNAQIC